MTAARSSVCECSTGSSLYPTVVSKRGVAHFTSNTNIFGLGIRANGKAFTSIDALSGVTSATKTIPHIANGGSWKTTFLIVCTAAHAAQFTLNCWDEQGKTLLLPLGADGTVSSLSGTIKPGELRVVQTTGAGSLVTGWAELTGLTGAIGGTAIFALQSPGQSDSEAAVPFSTTASTQEFMPYDYSSSYSTGIALTNTSPSQATVTATFTDDGGNNLGSGVPIIVPAHGHTSAVLASLQAAIAGTRGMVSLKSNVPIFGLGIRANGRAFTSLRVINSTGLVITAPAPLAAGTAGVTYSVILSASGGAPPYVWSITDGSLPPGLSLDASTGIVSGIPTTSGTFTPSVQVSDSKGAAFTEAFSLTIH